MCETHSHKDTTRESSSGFCFSKVSHQNESYSGQPAWHDASLKWITLKNGTIKAPVLLPRAPGGVTAAVLTKKAAEFEPIVKLLFFSSLVYQIMPSANKAEIRRPSPMVAGWCLGHLFLDLLVYLASVWAFFGCMFMMCEGLATC